MRNATAATADDFRTTYDRVAKLLADYEDLAIVLAEALDPGEADLLADDDVDRLAELVVEQLSPERVRSAADGVQGGEEVADLLDRLDLAVSAALTTRRRLTRTASAYTDLMSSEGGPVSDADALRLVNLATEAIAELLADDEALTAAAEDFLSLDPAEGDPEPEDLASELVNLGSDELPNELRELAPIVDHLSELLGFDQYRVASTLVTRYRRVIAEADRLTLSDGDLTVTGEAVDGLLTISIARDGETLLRLGASLVSDSYGSALASGDPVKVEAELLGRTWFEGEGERLAPLLAELWRRFEPVLAEQNRDAERTL